MVDHRPIELYVGEATKRHYWSNSRDGSLGNDGQQVSHKIDLRFSFFQHPDLDNPQVQKFYRKYGEDWKEKAHLRGSC